MSNVLLGIIGVILFIGLALAGALFLGEEFQKASQRNKAMLLAQMAAQISAAASLSETETGREIAARSSVSNLVISGYLRTLPINPYLDEGGYPFREDGSENVWTSVTNAPFVSRSLLETKKYKPKQ